MHNVAQSYVTLRWLCRWLSSTAASHGVGSQVTLRAANARLKDKKRSQESLNVTPALWCGQMRGLVGFTMGLLDREYTQCGFVAWWGTFLVSLRAANALRGDATSPA